MQCLQCGKDIPLLKRLSGGEFCSDTHRRDYEQKYSQLALDRLREHVMQPGAGRPPVIPLRPSPQPSAPVTATPVLPNGKANPPKSIELPGALAPDKPAPRLAPVVPKPPAKNLEPKVSEAETPKAAPAPTPMPKATPAPAPSPMENAPPFAAVVTHKPPASQPAFEIMVAPEGESLIQAAVPHRPRRDPQLSSAQLLRGTHAPWERTCEMRDSRSHAVEARLEARSFAKTTPVMDLDLRIGGTGRWNTARANAQFTGISASVPEGAAIWHAAARDFAGEMSALGEFLDSPLPPIVILRSSAASAGDRADDQTAPAVTQTGQRDSAARGPSKPLPAVPIPFDWSGTPAARAKPMHVFQSWLPDPRTGELDTPETLPLRPMMILIAAPKEGLPSAKPVAELLVSAASAVPKPRKADVRILPPEKTPAENHRSTVPLAVVPSAPEVSQRVVARPLQSIKRDNLGLPEFRSQPTGAEIAARIWTKVAGLRGRK